MTQVVERTHLAEDVRTKALAAALDYVRTTTRPVPGLDSAKDDPYLQLQAGRLSARLHAAHALQRTAAEALVQADGGRLARGEASVAVARSKIVTTDTVLDTTLQVFQLMGARATSDRYRLDRFLRNARTLTLHDPIDRKAQLVGAKLLTGADPMPTFIS